MRKLVNVVLTFLLIITLTSITLFRNKEVVAANDYYSSITTKEGLALASQLHTLTGQNFSSKSYSSLWSYYPQTDYYIEDGVKYVWDMYSNVKHTFSNYNGGNSPEGAGMNKEHSIPQSWFNEASPMVSDLFHVYPTDCYVNNMRGSYPFGEVGVANYTSGNGSKRGTSNFPGYTGVVFEPIDEYKGDFARTYMYFAIRYSDKISSWSKGSVKSVFANNYPYLTTYSINLFTKWHVQDPVSQKEIDRNNAVYGIQNNRNPFIDHPEYANYIWGAEYQDDTDGKCGLIFDVGNATFNYEDSTRYDVGSLINEPNVIPYLAGYEFKGWYKDARYTTKWNFSTDKIQESMTLYAKFEYSQDPLKLFEAVKLEVALNLKYKGTTSSLGQALEESINISGLTNLSGLNNTQYGQIKLIDAVKGGYTNAAIITSLKSLVIYSQGKFTISSDKVITKIEFQLDNGYNKSGKGLTADCGYYEVSGESATWEGNTNSVTFEAGKGLSGGNQAIKGIKVYYGGSDTTYELKDFKILVRFKLDGDLSVIGKDGNYSFMINNQKINAQKSGNYYIAQINVSNVSQIYNIKGMLELNGEAYTKQISYSFKTLAEKYLANSSEYANYLSLLRAIGGLQ